MESISWVESILYLSKVKLTIVLKFFFMDNCHRMLLTMTNSINDNVLLVQSIEVKHRIILIFYSIYFFLINFNLNVFILTDHFRNLQFGCSIGVHEVNSH